MKSTLIFWGGWEGHFPEKIALLFKRELEKKEFRVTLSDSLSCLESLESLQKYDLIIPNWTMGTLSQDQSQNLFQAVQNGSGLGGAHGGMCDAFRGDINYQLLSGGQFLHHSHVGSYQIKITQPDHPIMSGISPEFEYDSEQYYMMTDPGIDILADTTYHYDNQSCQMPVVWTKKHGKGKVFYSALGHHPDEFETYPHVLQMTIQGLCWAARSSSEN